MKLLLNCFEVFGPLNRNGFFGLKKGKNSGWLQDPPFGNCSLHLSRDQMGKNGISGNRSIIIKELGFLRKYEGGVPPPKGVRTPAEF